jgi:ABC-type amino acid transport substrate-binding protein
MRTVLVLVFTLLALASSHAGMLDEIEKTRVLKVCMWPDYFGISYRSPMTGEFQGIDIDLSKALANDLGVKLEYVVTDFSRLMEDLEAHKCQIAMMGVGITPERAARADFSSPYLRSDVYAITTSSNGTIKRWDDIDQPGRVVAVQKGTYMEPLMRKILKHATLHVVTRQGEREREVESGSADAFITDYPYSQRMLMNTDWARVIEPARQIQLTDYAYVVPKGENTWLARVNLFVSQIKKDGRLYDAARQQHLLPIMVKN